MKDLKKWYRCVTREEMIQLISNGFDYTNIRRDKYNNGDKVYYFERTEEFTKYLASTARV